MNWDSIVDYSANFVGAFIAILPLFFIPEVKRSTGYKSFASIAFILIIVLGSYNIKRNGKKETDAQSQYENTSKKLEESSKKLDIISQNYARDTMAFRQFKEELKAKFKIADSLSHPVQIFNYKPTYNTHINNAKQVNI